MCEGNSDQLVPTADRVIELLSRARESLASHNSAAELIESGHAARTRYDSFPRSDIFHVIVGAENWRQELAAAGRAGGVIRSALPSLDSRR
jgi:prephenate dehydrogenase